MKTTNFKYLHVSYQEFNLNMFIKILTQNFKLNTTYSLLLKISSDNYMTFKMCGPQIGIVIKESHDLEYYSKLFDLIITRIEITIDKYNYMDHIEGLEIMYSVINPIKELTLKNLKNYNLNQQWINKNKVKKEFNENLLPLTFDTSYFGYNIVLEERENLIQKIKSNNTIITKDSHFSINKNDAIFIYNSPNKKKNFIIVSKTLNNNNFIREIYDLSTGIFVVKVIDNTTNNLLFYRTIGNITITFDKEKIIKYKVNTQLQPIKAPKLIISDRNLNFGTFDLETFKDLDGLAKVYALGFYTYKDDLPKLYYITDYPDLDYSNFILKCIDDMLVNKYNNFIFYAHNLANYDIVFIYNVLLKSNSDKNYDYYILNTTMRDNTIIKLDIKIKTKSNTDTGLNKYNYLKISFVDSLNLLNTSLEKLTKEFSFDTKKGKFPHSFVNENTLNYIGKKPDFSFYDNFNKDDYHKIPINNWNLKLECLNYLTKDIKGLYLVLYEFSRLIYIHFNIQMVDSLTITRLALNIFKQNFYNNQKIPSINKIFLFNFIKEGYFGGITEVYRPFAKDAAYIDINSLYPFAALNPMPGTDCHYLESFDDKGLDLENLFGFFYAKVKTNNQYLGLLPVHSDKGLILPNGEFSGIWCSEELKFAKSKGYNITVMKGYQFNKVIGIFNSYVLELYNLKKKATGLLKLIYKSLLNNFLGRFGLNIVKPITHTVNRERRDFIFSTRVVHSENMLNPNKFLITYEPLISNNICLNHGLDITKVLEKEYKTNIETKLDYFKDVSIATSAFVNSYARIHINKFKLDVLDRGGRIYYSDTDSLVLDKNLLKKEWLGTEIGKFKLEYEIKEGYFISNKTYCLLLNNGETIIKTKGVINSTITIEQFKSMYFDKKNIKATKFNTITNYEKASVLIEKKEVVLNYDSYTKREKIYNNQSMWIDTKPLDY
uniref:DNA polymerase n=1 Tax=Calocybe cyanea TaxID=181965 RepID=A0A8F1ACR7_9AGAR|nr:DNA polymerase [Calocybe cyanea]